MAQQPTNLNKPPEGQQILDPKTGKFSAALAAWFAAIGAVASWSVTGALTAATGAFSTSMTAPVGGILGSNPLLHVREEQASGTAGGAFNNGAWRTRVLNTTKTNQITGGGLGVAPAGANQILLPAGTYWLSAQAPATFVDAHKLKVANITDATDLLIGNGSFNPSVFAQITTDWVSVWGEFTLAAPKVIEVQHQCATSRAGNGFGNSTGFGVVEVYAEVMIWKLE